MEYTVEKLPNLHNKDLKVVQAKPRPVPEGLYKANSLICLCANRGAGKTNCWINMLLKYQNETKTYDVVYLICPTIHNDPKYKLLERKGFELKMYDQFDNDIFKGIVEEINDNIDEYKEYQRKMKIWKKFLKAKRVENLDANDLLELELMDFQEPETKFIHGFPQHLIIFDDMMANPYAYPSSIRGNLLTRFTILHRHRNTGIWHSVQSWKSVLHKSIRNNLTGMILFKNKSEEIKKEIAQEVANYIKPNLFIELWDRATEDDHDFFMCDFNPTEKKYRFRKNFDQLFVLTQ